jgi:hypothetical protein
VYDPKDGYLPGAALDWTLSGHGSLGTGEAVSLTGLADGPYTLTLTASDSSDQVAVKSITFRIGEAGGVRIYLPFVMR